MIMVSELLTNQVDYNVSFVIVDTHLSIILRFCFHSVRLALSESLQTTTTRWRHSSLSHTGTSYYSVLSDALLWQHANVVITSEIVWYRMGLMQHAQLLYPTRCARQHMRLLFVLPPPISLKQWNNDFLSLTHTPFRQTLSESVTVGRLRYTSDMSHTASGT